MNIPTEYGLDSKLYKTPMGYMFYIFLSDAYFIEQVATDYEIAKERVETIIIADRLRRENGESISQCPNNQQDNSDT